MLSELNKYKSIHTIIFLVILLCIGNIAFGQDFYNQYKAHLFNRSGTHNLASEINIDASIERLHQTFDKFEIKKGHSILSTDTIYILGVSYKKHSIIIIWNSNESCQYEYTSKRVGPNYYRKNLNIKSDGGGSLKRIPKQVKQWIIGADTLDFSESAKKNKLLNHKDTWSSFTRAIKVGDNWKFISGSSYYIEL